MTYNFINPELDMTKSQRIRNADYYQEKSSGLWVRQISVSNMVVWVPRNVGFVVDNKPTGKSFIPSYGYVSTLGWQVRIYRSDTDSIDKFFNVNKEKIRYNI